MLSAVRLPAGQLTALSPLVDTVGQVGKPELDTAVFKYAKQVTELLKAAGNYFRTVFSHHDLEAVFLQQSDRFRQPVHQNAQNRKIIHIIHRHRSLDRAMPLLLAGFGLAGKYRNFSQFITNGSGCINSCAFPLVHLYTGHTEKTNPGTKAATGQTAADSKITSANATMNGITSAFDCTDSGAVVSLKTDRGDVTVTDVLLERIVYGRSDERIAHCRPRKPQKAIQ